MAAPAAKGRLMTNGLVVAAPFGGGGVSDVTYDIANADEMQVLISGGLGEAETGGPSINIVPKSGGNLFRGSAFYSTSGDWATSNNVDDELRALGITQPPTLRTNWDTSASLGGPIMRDRLWFFANVRAWANASVVDGIFANQFAGDASHWDYAVDRSIEARQCRVEEDRRRPADGAADAAEPGDVLARLPAPLRRVVAEVGRRWLPAGRPPAGSRRAGRSAPTPCRRRRSPAITTSRTTPPRPPTRRRSATARWSRRGYSRFAYGYARFGMAAPDGLMDIIPVTEQTGIYGRPQLLVSRRVRSARLRLQRQRRPAVVVARGAVLRHRRAQPQGRLLGLFLGGAQRPRAEPHAAALHVQLQRAGDHALHRRRTATACARPTCPTSCRRAGTSTTARRRSACSPRTSGRSGA